ncbi:MAG: response regulator [Parcubacteria group bacterium]|nr:response regulator [Parcubacteria group bacterium]
MEKYILIIEDDQSVQRAYQLKFAKQNAMVKPLINGKEALNYIKDPKSNPPTVIILDLMLPGASGFEILSEIKKIESWKSVPVIVISNLSQMADVDKIKALGIADFLIKANARIDTIIEKVIKYYNEAK